MRGESWENRFALWARRKGPQSDIRTVEYFGVDEVWINTRRIRPCARPVLPSTKRRIGAARIENHERRKQFSQVNGPASSMARTFASYPPRRHGHRNFRPLPEEKKKAKERALRRADHGRTLHLVFARMAIDLRETIRKLARWQKSSSSNTPEWYTAKLGDRSVVILR